MATRDLSIGRARAPAGDASAASPLALSAHHLVTHGVIVGMTGSGKTGLAMVLVEEALLSRIPVVVIDVKGDLPNLLLNFPALAPEEFAPWVDAEAAARAGRSVADVALGLSKQWTEGLAGFGLGAGDVAGLRAAMAPRILTPGTTAGEPLNVLSSLETRSALWEEDEEAAREGVSASISLLLRLIERDADPARSREHVVLSLLAERRHRARLPAGLAELLADLAKPPVASVGALGFDDFLPPKERQTLAQELNALLASPTFASWRTGAPLDVAAWLRRGDSGKTPAVIVSVAHLDDAERMLVLGLLLEQLLSWVRSLPGTSELRALVLFDEVFGFLPPHPHNPPSKRPLLALLKQARAFGVGLVLATQNPMDLDYKALSNAGMWFIGRLQTDADRQRVVEGLAGADAGGGALDVAELGSTLKGLPPRTFFLRDVHRTPPSALFETRFTLSWLRGPMTRREIGRLRGPSAAPNQASAPAVATPAPVSAPAPAPRTAPAAQTAVPASATGSTIPEPPDGWRSFHALAPPQPPAAWCYTPHVAATVVAHVRDDKLGIALNRSRTVVAPLAATGGPDMTRVADVDRTRLGAAPAAGARYQPVPAALFRQKARQAAERALRDHVYRTLEVTVDCHRDLALVRGEGEAPQAFVERCHAEALRRVSTLAQELQAKHAPKLAKLSARLSAAQGAVAQAEGDVAAAPGAVGAALVGVVAGARAGQRLHTQQARAAARLDKAKSGLEAAAAALRAAVSERDAALATLGQMPAQVHLGIETRRLAPKKRDIEVTEVGIAWAVV
jgi:hypothetical protein